MLCARCLACERSTMRSEILVSSISSHCSSCPGFARFSLFVGRGLRRCAWAFSFCSSSLSCSALC